jgi:AcrR family transcriptional regulator
MPARAGKGPFRTAAHPRTCAVLHHRRGIGPTGRCSDTASVNNRPAEGFGPQAYAAGPACHVALALKEPTARRVAQALLDGTIRLLTSPQNPGGCLAVQGALACGDQAQSIRQTLSDRRGHAESLIRKRLERARAEGDLPPDSRPADLAAYLATVTHGLSVQAAGGASRAVLKRVADLALAAWPGPV